MQLTTVKIEKLDAANFILGQTHFINMVEDIHPRCDSPTMVSTIEADA